ncbi:hypothetical protein ACR78Z_13195 [Sphingobacterium thalpophilum]|uniref:Lipoprotein n=1 Tax=Sphingobacterium thalpophilum TaxID=259 RepID=A0A4U9UT78_9SPHI|nr:hypothetical protein [Sphingobacterium thalpophilum]VTR35322.1 Uncharacterised protein [Sphingobacterium thalpophilum]
MKTYFIPFVALLVSASSCNQTTDRQAHKTGDVDTLQLKSDAKLKTAFGFNLDQIPVSTSEVGEFPYLSAPLGYRHAGEKTKFLEEKYFFYNDSLIRKVSGQYYYTSVFKEGDVFEDTYLVSEYKKVIENLGGVEFYSGGLPASASELLDKEQPAYVSDMYDPRPYKYKQFLIRTPESNIWIELCHGLNANQVDLTVVKEEVTNTKGN